MEDHRLNFATAEDDTRQKTLDEIGAFIKSMYGRALAVVTLDTEQSLQWDQDGGFDYQEYYGQQIIDQIADGETETLVIRNAQGLPVALARRESDSKWRGLGIEKRLRQKFVDVLQIREEDLS